MNQPVICLFANDLRLADQPALSAAVASGAPVVPCYVLDDTAPDAPGAASRWWLHHSLAALGLGIAARGSRLVLRRGPLGESLMGLARDTGATAVYFSRRHGPDAAAEERRIRDSLAAAGVDCRPFGASLLFEPERILTATGGPYKVFTPFYRACLAQDAPHQPLTAPAEIPAPGRWPESDDLAGWRLRPSAPDWSGGLAESWTPGEAGAMARLEAFLGSGLRGYATARDRPDRAGTSRLSAHLHFGEISPRAIWQRARFAAGRDPALAAGVEGFLRQLLWREFCHYLLHHFPDLAKAPFRPEFAAFPWADDATALARWQSGRTGYPIVDAGMRELWRTGWMHNRLRMIVASFLVKDLMIHWRKGAEWFSDTLVDADAANNAAGWQWVAGCGADAAPYFRVFNPVLQARKFDPDGVYVRRWVPELARLPDKHLHAPWEAPAESLAGAGVRLGETYPLPMVEHGAARGRALAAFRRISRGDQAGGQPAS
ncbi:MAG: hypothetical protein RL477_723 [Pseudomonadota bacterium]